MAFFYLTRTVHLPLTAAGCDIKNTFGVTIARTDDSFTAMALAELANLGGPAAEAQERAHEAREDATLKLMLKRNKMRGI